MSFLTYEDDTVPWWWPGIVRSDQEREPLITVESVEKKYRHFRAEPLPVLMGITFLVTPFVVGGILVVVAPHPAVKVVGYSMMVPSPTDPVTFWVGYQVGEEIQDYF